MRKYYRNNIEPSKSVIFKSTSMRKHYRNNIEPSKSVIFSPDPERKDYRNISTNSNLPIYIRKLENA